jgi:hypothetical protein
VRSRSTKRAFGGGKGARQIRLQLVQITRSRFHMGSEDLHNQPTSRSFPVFALDDYSDLPSLLFGR